MRIAAGQPMRIFAIPVIAMVAVPALAALLLTVGARSPYTRSNLQLWFDPSYTRTQQALVGRLAPFKGAELVAPPASAADPAVRGHELMVSRGCTACHGLNGQGGAVGPAIVGANVEMLRLETREGPAGMPAFSPVELTDGDLAAIAAYLRATAAAAAPLAVPTPVVSSVAPTGEIEANVPRIVAVATLAVPTPVVSNAAPSGQIEAGAKVFAAKCSSCHPGARAGIGPALYGPEFDVRYPEDSELKQAIRQGKGGMPARSLSLLSDADLNLVVAYLHSLKSALPVVEPTPTLRPKPSG